MERRANNTKVSSLSRRRLARKQAPVIEEQARANLEPAEHFSNDSGFGGDLLSCDNPEALLPLYRLIRRPSNESMLTETDYAPAKRARRSYNSGSNSPDSPSSVDSPISKKETCDDSIFSFPVPSTPTEYGSELEQSNASSIDSSPVQRKGTTKRRRKMHSDSMGTFRHMTSELKGNHPSRSRDGLLQLKILSQPEKQHRARYLTEGSRGAVKDRHGEGYPVVKLIGPYDNPITLQVFIANDEGKIVSPHMHYQACKICGRNASRCQETKIDGTVVIEIQMDSATDALSCDCVGILKERNVDVEARFGQISGNARRRSTRCRMVFRTRIHNSDGSSELLQVVSDPILCTQPPGVPEIQKVSLDSSPVIGGKELFIIGKNFAKDSEVVFREVDDSTEEFITKWEQTVQPDRDLYNQNHLVCLVPPYRDIKVTHNVRIQMLVSCCEKLSDPHEFTYLPVKPVNEEQAVAAPALPKGVALPALEINRRFAETGEVPMSLSLEMSKTLSQQPFMKSNPATIVSQQSHHLDSGTAAVVAPYSLQLLKPTGTEGSHNDKTLQPSRQFNTAIENSPECPLLLQWQTKTPNERPQNLPNCVITDLEETKGALSSQNNFPSIVYTVQPSGDAGSSVAVGSESMLCKTEEPQLEGSPINDPNPISPLSHTSISRTRKRSNVYSPSLLPEDPEVIVEGSSSKMLNFSISGQVTMSCPDNPEQREVKFSFNTDTKYNDIRGKTMEQVMTEEIKKSLKPIVNELSQPDSNLDNSSDARSPFTNGDQKQNATKSEVDELREELRNLTEVVQSLKAKPNQCNSRYLVTNFQREANSSTRALRAPEILLDTAMDALEPPLPMGSGVATSFRDSIVQKTLTSSSNQEGHLPIFNLGAKASLSSTLPMLQISSSIPSTSLTNGSRENCQSVSAAQQAPILFVSTNATQNIVPANAIRNIAPANPTQNIVPVNSTQEIVNATQNIVPANATQNIVPANVTPNFTLASAKQNIVPTTTLENRFSRTSLPGNLFNCSDLPSKTTLLNNLDSTNSKALLLELSKTANTTPFYTNTMKAPVPTLSKEVSGINNTCPPAIFDKQPMGKMMMGDSNSFVGILNREENRMSNKNIHILGQQVPSGPSPNEWTAKRKYDWGEVIKHEAPSQQVVMKKSLPMHSGNTIALNQLQPANNAPNDIFIEKEPIKTPDLRYPVLYDYAGQSIPDNSPKLSREDPLLSSTLIVEDVPTTQGDKLQNLKAADVMNYLNTVCSSGQDDKKAQL